MAPRDVATQLFLDVTVWSDTDLKGGGAMKKRSRIPARKSRRVFTKHAAKTHVRNVSNAPRKMPMRGGIRL